MALLTLQDAEGIAGRGRPWTIRLEFVGANPANVSGVSSKYWYATGRGLHEPVEAGWGTIGDTPQYQLIDWPELEVRVADKLAKGYQFVGTPFVRMSAGNLAIVTGNPVSTPPMAKAVSSLTPARATAPAVKPAPVHPTVPPVAVVHQAGAAQRALQHPRNLVCSLKLLRDGTRVTGYSARDANEAELLVMGASEGADFARTYNVDVIF